MKYPFRIIDADGHVTETPDLFNLWASRMPVEHQQLAPRHYSSEGGGRYWIVEGKIWPAYKDRDRGMDAPKKAPGMWIHRKGEQDPHERMPDMDYMGVDLSVLYCSSMVGVPAIVEDPRLAGAISRVYNDWISEYCNAYPDRLKAVAMIPVQDGHAAAAELRRSVETLGLVGAFFPPFWNNLMPDNPHYFPIYEAAQDLNVPICIHNNSAINPSRHLFDNFVLRHAYSTAPLQMACGSVVIGGVLDKFPRLRFAFLEAGGGWAPYMMERMQDRFELLPHWVDHLKKSPEEYMRGEQMYYSFEPDEKTAPAVASILGEDRLVIGTDYAHWDGTTPESINMIMNRCDFSDELKQKILSENPARLYNV